MIPATRRTGATPAQPKWLVVIHQRPAQPHYLRVKIGRQLRDLGAVGIKNSVYVVPNGPEARGSLRKLVRELHARGGQAVVCEAHFVDGLSDETAQDLFRQ